jgi:hypothetical protein
MKASVPIFALLLFFCNGVKAEKDLKNDYQIDSTLFRSHLKEGEAIYHFTFHNLPALVFRGGKQVPTSSHTIIYSYNGTNNTVTLGKDKILEIKVKPGKYNFQFYLNDHYEEISTEIIESRSRHKTFVSCYFQASEHRVVCEKPVIYLYPEEETNVLVEVKPKGSFTFTYPTYSNGWNVTATPTGELIQGENTYNYLFWESDQVWKPDPTIFLEGSIVKKEEITAFLESNLDAFGLNSKEKADFITYWGPQLIRHNSNFIHFMINEEANEFAELNITPQPDHIYRIYMISYPIENHNVRDCKPQNLPKINRSGFTAIEWGGTILETVSFNKVEL